MSEERMNLRGKTDKLTYYREKDVAFLEERSRLLDTYNESSKKIYYYPVKNRVLFTEDEVRKFTLDQYGSAIPYIEGHLTILHNYFFDFWGYYLNAEGTALYAHLKRFAYGEKDYCYPNLDLIATKMDKTRPTLNKYIELLERYGFIYQFGVLNESRNNMEESPLFKIRKQIPLLTEKLIYGNPDLEIPETAPKHIQKVLMKEKEGLPEPLRKEHEKFVERYMNNDINTKIEESINYEAIYQVWEKYGKLLKKTKPGNRKTVDEKQATLIGNMNESEKFLLSILLEKVSKKVSKPSFDTWFRNISIKLEEKTLIILAPNEFAKDWIENNYHNMIMEFVSHIDSVNIDHLKIEQII